MDRTNTCPAVAILIIIAGILIAGCSTPDTKDQAVQTTVTPADNPKYSVGDIVRNPSSTTATAFLILGYDAATDSYERALVNKNPDGSWGYRIDNRTDSATRVVMEKVYTDIVDSKDPSEVPIVTPTAPPATPTMTWVPLSTATTVVSTAPRITKILPDHGDAGTTVEVTDLVGMNFANPASVRLRRAGSIEIPATSVKAVSNTSITCSIAIPSSAAAGAWDVVVTNPDGQSATYTNIFLVHQTISAGLTTAATSAGTIPIYFIDPAVGHYGDNQITVTGANFQKGAKVTLQKTGMTDITARETDWSGNTTLTVFIAIPRAMNGAWDFRVTNPDGSYGVNFGKFIVN